MLKDKFSEKKYQKMEKKEVLKKATLAAFLCWFSVLIIWAFLIGASELGSLNSLRKRGIYWAEFEGGIKKIIIVPFFANFPFLFLFLIIGFYFGIRSFQRGKKTLPYFQALISLFISIVILFIFVIIISRGEIFPLGIPYLVLGFGGMFFFYLIFIPVICFFIKKNLLSLYAKGVGALAILFLILFGAGTIIIGHDARKFEKIRSTFESLAAEAIQKGDLNLCYKIKEVAERNPQQVKKNNLKYWRGDYFNPCLEEVAIYRKEENICEGLLPEDDYYTQDTGYIIKHCKVRVFVAKLDQGNLPQNCKFSPGRWEAFKLLYGFETIERYEELEKCLKDIASKTKNPDICKKLLDLEKPESYDECYQEVAKK